MFYKTKTMQECISIIEENGFDELINLNLSHLFSVSDYFLSMLRIDDDAISLNEFGTNNYYNFKYLPVYIGSIKAIKNS